MRGRGPETALWGWLGLWTSASFSCHHRAGLMSQARNPGAPQVYPTKHGKNNMRRSFSSSSKRGRNTPRGLWSHRRPDTKTRQRHHHTHKTPQWIRHEGWRKRKNVAVLPSNVPDEPNSIAFNRTEIWPCHLASDEPSFLFTLGSGLLTWTY